MEAIISEIGSDAWWEDYSSLEKEKKEAEKKHQESIRINNEIEAKLREFEYSNKKNLISKFSEDKKNKQLQEELNKSYINLKNDYIELLEITKKHNEKTIEIKNYNYDKVEEQLMAELKRSADFLKEMVEMEKQKMTTSNPDFNEIQTLKNEKITLQNEVDKLKKIIDKGEKKYKILKTEYDKSVKIIDELNEYIDELEGK